MRWSSRGEREEGRFPRCFFARFAEEMQSSGIKTALMKMSSHKAEDKAKDRGGCRGGDGGKEEETKERMNGKEEVNIELQKPLLCKGQAEHQVLGLLLS